VTRSSKATWVEAGFVLLRDGGQDMLTIERLCEALAKTKGSFYHHFESMDVYLDAILLAWEERNTNAPIEEANRSKDRAARRSSLDSAVKRADSRLDIAVRAWGLRDARARAHVARVDEARVHYLAELFSPAIPRSKRLALGRLQYAAFLGNQQLDPTFTASETKAVEKLLAQAIDHLGRIEA
jgi:AcrR family transcriptional regulator